MINQEQKAIDSESAIRHGKMSYHLFPKQHTIMLPGS